MKKLIASLLVCSTLFSCKKEENTNVNAPSSEALAVNDNSSAGIYKGVMIGSTGTIKLVALNGNSTVKAYVTFNGVKDTLSTSANIVAGQTITNATFSGTKMSLVFNAANNGANPTISSINMNGYTNPITGLMVKELSSRLATCYAGTFKGTNSTSSVDSGYHSLILYGNQAVGLIKSYFGTQVSQATGTFLTNGDISIGSTSLGTTFTGNIGTTNGSGTWSNSNSGYTGTWICTKSL